MRVAPALLVLSGAAVGCASSDSTAIPPAPLQLFAFPHEVEPSGQATITVQIAIDHAHCQTVCLGLPTTEGGGRLYPPPGVAIEPGSSIALPISSPPIYQSITYVAPAHEGSEVVSAACYAASAVDCTKPQPPESVQATTTTRIVIRKPTPEATDAGGAPGSSGGAPDSGGTAGSAGGGPDGESGTGGSGVGGA